MLEYAMLIVCVCVGVGVKYTFSGFHCKCLAFHCPLKYSIVHMYIKVIFSAAHTAKQEPTGVNCVHNI